MRDQYSWVMTVLKLGGIVVSQFCLNEGQLTDSIRSFEQFSIAMHS
jgi:sRNA-binding regulator protein Hfq